MATLPSGAPYMLASDANDTIDNYTLDNANYWDDRVPNQILTGTVSVSAPNTTPSTTTVPFSTAFSVAPTVVLTLNTSHSGNVNIAVSAVSTTGFTFRAYHNLGATTTIGANWLAVQL